MDIEKANGEAVERMMEARPVLVGLGKAIDVIPGMKDNLLLHAGPPITWERASGPMQGAITGALIFEGKAKNMKEAQKLVKSARFSWNPATIINLWAPWQELPALQCLSISWKTKPTRIFLIPI